MWHFEEIESFGFRMLHAFDFKFSWLPDGAIDSVVEKIDVLVREDVTSMLTLQMIVLDLAADCVNPGRMMMVHFFSESVKEHLVKRICGISKSEYESQSWLQWFRNLFTEQGRNYRRLIRETEHVKMICLVFSHLRVQTNEKVNIQKEIM